MSYHAQLPLFSFVLYQQQTRRWEDQRQAGHAPHLSASLTSGVCPSRSYFWRARTAGHSCSLTSFTSFVKCHFLGEPSCEPPIQRSLSPGLSPPSHHSFSLLYITLLIFCSLPFLNSMKTEIVFFSLSHSHHCSK